MGIVGDKLICKEETDKTKGYDLKDGRTTQKSGVIDVTVSRGQPKKKELNQNGKSKDCSEPLGNCGIKYLNIACLHHGGYDMSRYCHIADIFCFHENV